MIRWAEAGRGDPPGASRTLATSRSSRPAVFVFLLGGGAACKRPPDFRARDVAVELAATVTASPPRIALSWPTGALPTRRSSCSAKLARRRRSWAHRRRSSRRARRPGSTTDIVPGIAYDYFVERKIAGTAGRAPASCEPAPRFRWSRIAARSRWSWTEHRPGVAVRGDRAPGRGSSRRRMDPGARTRGTRLVAARGQRDDRGAPSGGPGSPAAGAAAGSCAGSVLRKHRAGSPLSPDGKRADPHAPGRLAGGHLLRRHGGRVDRHDRRHPQNEYPPTDPVNVNVPGDGKFDQASATTDDRRPRGARSLAPHRRGRIALAIGRVDLSELPPSPPKRDRPPARVPRQGSSFSPRAVGR